MADAEGRLLICKGAVDETLDCCVSFELKGEVYPLTEAKRAEARRLAASLGGEGFRVLALGYRRLPREGHGPVYAVADESELILVGFLAFFDPPKATAREALSRLKGHAVAVKVLTGDSDAVATSICRQVGMAAERVLLGSEIEAMSDEELAEAADGVEVFARLSPSHKERIVRALKSRGRVVGFLGDGINDAPALKAADVGISVDSAVDIAKESSDIILLENSLTVLDAGVTEGRRVFGNMMKYIKMAASSNFGNMFSVLGASLFLPFVPMLPIQVLANNLLYDLSQTAIPTDSVDEDWLAAPRRWDIAEIRRFILGIGPLSSIFDYLTYFIMIRFFGGWNNPALFRTGWFIESIFTQTLIIHVIRTRKIPFIQSRASRPLMLASAAVLLAAASLPYSPLAPALGLVALPPLYWAFLAGMILSYLALTQAVKNRFNRSAQASPSLLAQH
jgi:Mg2+-importing ATPase